MPNRRSVCSSSSPLATMSTPPDLWTPHPPSRCALLAVVMEELRRSCSPRLGSRRGAATPPPFQEPWTAAVRILWTWLRHLLHAVTPPLPSADSSSDSPRINVVAPRKAMPTKEARKRAAGELGGVRWSRPPAAPARKELGGGARLREDGGGARWRRERRVQVRRVAPAEEPAGGERNRGV
jgi:hypothetical protein